jgi:hypothetical protein
LAHRRAKIFAQRWYGSCVKLFSGFCLTPAFRACYKETGAIHIDVRRHTNRKYFSAAAFDASRSGCARDSSLID